MKKPQIAIDTRWLQGPATGVGRYIGSTVREFPNLPAKHRYLLWGEPVRGRGLRNVPFSGWRQKAWERYWRYVAPWPGLDQTGPTPDLWHFTNYLAEPTRRPYVLSMCDLGYVRHPEFIAERYLARLRRGVPKSAERAERIITISEFTKREIVSTFGTDPDKITVTHLAADRRFFRTAPARDRERVVRKYRLPERYLLAVGNLEPRKNLATLFRAFAKVKDEIPQDLVIVGARGWLFEDTERLVGKLGITSRVHFPGFVADADLPAVYQSADCFVYPSRYEGFGIPPLEAMASGTPVISSNAASLPEVVGEAAVTLPPMSAAKLADAIGELVNSPARRRSLAARGRKQARSFSWKRTARQTVAVYDAVLREIA